MPLPVNGPRRLGFGLFEADLSAHQIHRSGTLIHVQEKPFQILSMLLEHPGEVVTREELRRRLWPADTFVDFDEGLNTAIKKLRHVLRDSPDNPTFLKHSLGFFLVEQGCSLPYVQQALGHKHLASTACYLRVTDELTNKQLARAFAAF